MVMKLSAIYLTFLLYQVTKLCSLLILSLKPTNHAVWPQVSSGQDYSVSDIDCEYGGSYQASMLSAQLTKPDGFIGSPMFADDRLTDPAAGGECSIRQAGQDTTG